MEFRMKHTLKEGPWTVTADPQKGARVTSGWSLGPGPV